MDREASQEMKETEPKTVKSRAPLRVSFSGGGTDVPPFSEDYGGCVVSTRIDKYIQAEVSPSPDPNNNVLLMPDLDVETKLPFGEKYVYHEDDASQDERLDIPKAALNEFADQPVKVYIHGDALPGGGLATSTASCVALIGAFTRWKGKPLDKREIAEEAIRHERDLVRAEGGFQDQYASSYGGFNFIEFLPGKKRVVHPLSLSRETIDKLHESLGLFYLGGVHSERTQQAELIKSMKTNLDAIEALKRLKEQTTQMRDALVEGDLETFGKLLHQGWLLKKMQSKKISGAEIDAFYDLALQSGALGGKLLGSGGAGYMLLFMPPEKRKHITEELTKMGGKELIFDFDKEGVAVS